MGKRLKTIFIVLVMVGLTFGLIWYKNSRVTTEEGPRLVEYKNTEYGFSISLPETWENFSVSIDTWTGYAIDDQLGDEEYTHGPVVSIHNPKWTAENLYQDIPVMVFTTDQWNMLQEEKFHIGAAPIGPSILGSNSNYVFALPARYNYSFPPGYEEVEEILKGSPLKTF